MQREFAVEQGGQKRLTASWDFGYANARIGWDGAIVAEFPTRAELERGASITLPDGSPLEIRLGKIDGAPFLTGVHLRYRGAPVPGSAADRVPAWVWPFAVACALIPVVTVGGAIPGAIGFGGAGAALTLARHPRLTPVLRAASCAALVVTCWGAVAALAYAGGNPTVTRMFMSRSPEKLLAQLRAEYLARGQDPRVVEDSITGMRAECAKMKRPDCVEYLRSTLIPLRATKSRSSETPAVPPEKLLGDIRAQYLSQGAQPWVVDDALASMRVSCNQMKPAECSQYLQSTLDEMRAKGRSRR